MRLLKAVTSKAHIECSKVLNARDSDKFYTVSGKIDTICSRAEDNMFDDFPTLNNDYLDIFYGSPETKTRNDVDQEQIDLMIELVKELFGDNWK